MPSAAQARSGDGPIELNDYPDVIDMAVFEQILEMDDTPEDREFSQSIVTGFFDQAEQTLDKMRDKHAQGDLSELSALGHFMKGSSATLGLIKLQRTFEKIQNYGAQKDASGNTPEPDRKKCLDRISDSLKAARIEYAEAKQILVRFFNLDPDEFP